MIVCVLGMAGSGKSTLTRALAARLGGVRMHPGQFAWDKRLVATPFPSRADLLAVPQLTELFLQAVAEASLSTPVFVDGFPRNCEQARKLVESGLQPAIVHLKFPAGQEIEWSVARQEVRIKAENVSIERCHLEQQAHLAFEHDLAAVDELRKLGMPVLDLDALAAPGDNERLILPGGAPRVGQETRLQS